MTHPYFGFICGHLFFCAPKKFFCAQFISICHLFLIGFTIIISRRCHLNFSGIATLFLKGKGKYDKIRFPILRLNEKSGDTDCCAIQLSMSISVTEKCV